MIIHEDEKRRSDWIEGRSIQLENDEWWEVPLPRIDLKLSLAPKVDPIFVEPERETNRNFGKRFWAAKDTLQAAWTKYDEDLDLVALCTAILPMAAELLRRNYDLTDIEIESLFILKPHDDRNQAMWMTMLEIAMGYGPKAATAG